MCTSPQVITLLPLLCRTPACISAHLNRASLNVHVSALCIILLNLPTPARYPSAHVCRYVHNLDLHKHPIWAEAHFFQAPPQGPHCYCFSWGSSPSCVAPLVSGLKIGSWLPLQGQNLSRTSLQPFLTTQRARSGQNHPSCLFK